VEQLEKLLEEETPTTAAAAQAALRKLAAILRQQVQCLATMVQRRRTVLAHLAHRCWLALKAAVCHISVVHQGPGHAAMYDLALLLAGTRNWFEPFRRYEPFQAKFWHAASETKPIPKEQYRCRTILLDLTEHIQL
jgi:hypothetical protein